MKLVLALALAVLAACAKSAPPAPAPAPSPSTAAAIAAVTDAALALDATPAAIARDAIELLATDQLVTAIVPDWASTTAELKLWKRDHGTWKLMDTWPGVVGTSGTAWGVGVHGTGAPAGRTGPVKREGDGKSPAGIFKVRKSYGYDGAAKTALSYQAVDANWKCVDDAKSTQYTRIVDRRDVEVDWKSAEDMRRKDELYKWVVDLEHNPAAAPGAGSCIFLHVWRGPKSATVGCTAMDETVLAHLIAVLEPSAMFVLLPRAEYDALTPTWGLPR